MRSDDPAALALRMDREAFVARLPEPILVGVPSLIRSANAELMRTFPMASWDDTTVRSTAEMKAPLVAAWAIRKVRRDASPLITVGRAPVSDIVVPDETVSKLHAVFEPLNRGGFGLSDAGSSNGTWVDDVRLPAHGQPVRIEPGMRVRFAEVGLTVQSSGAFWESMHA